MAGSQLCNAMRCLVLWALLAPSTAFFGNAISGSEQLEAYMGLKCGKGTLICEHVLDVRTMFEHTFPGQPEPRLSLGSHPYLTLQVRTAYEAAYDVLIHHGNWSSSTSGALMYTLNNTGMANTHSLSCESDVFSNPIIFITIKRENVEDDSSFDFSFAIKKSLLKTTNSTTQAMVPGNGMSVLAVPVLGALSPESSSQYEVFISVVGIFPENAEVGLRVLGDHFVCMRVARGHAGNQKGLELSGHINGTFQVGLLESKIMFIGVYNFGPKRTLLDLKTVVKLKVQPRVSTSGSGAEETYLRYILLGDSLFRQGRMYEATEAFQHAHLLMPDRPLARARELQVWLASPPPSSSSMPAEDPTWGVNARSEVLYSMVQKVGDISGQIAKLAESGRASSIRIARDMLLHNLNTARHGSAELAASAGDLDGADLLMRSSVSDVAHQDMVYRQALWGAGELFKRFGAWKQASYYLDLLTHRDPTAWVVKESLASVYVKQGDFEKAKGVLFEALESSEEEPPASAVLLASEVVLAHGGCATYEESQKYVMRVAKNEAHEQKIQVLKALFFLCAGSVDDAIAGFQAPEQCKVLHEQCVRILQKEACSELPCADSPQTTSQFGGI